MHRSVYTTYSCICTAEYFYWDGDCINGVTHNHNVACNTTDVTWSNDADRNDTAKIYIIDVALSFTVTCNNNVAHNNNATISINFARNNNTAATISIDVAHNNNTL